MLQTHKIMVTLRKMLIFICKKWKMYVFWVEPYKFWHGLIHHEKIIKIVKLKPWPCKKTNIKKVCDYIDGACEEYNLFIYFIL